MTKTIESHRELRDKAHLVNDKGALLSDIYELEDINAELTAVVEETAKERDDFEAKALDLEVRCDEYRRQLGGTNAALHRCRQECRELRKENERLVALGAMYRRLYEDALAEVRKGNDALAETVGALREAVDACGEAAS